MNKICHICLIACIIALSSCQSLEIMTVEQLVPSDLSFPSSIRRVAVINNVNVQAPDNVVLGSDTTKLPFELTRKVTYHDGNSQLTTQVLAETIAEANYFDEVVISDSMLRANDRNIRETTLSRQEVNQLVNDLDVDMLIALENIQMKATRVVSHFLESGYLGTVDLRVYPSVNIYLPNRNAPLARVNTTDSIFWEGIFSTQVRAQTQVISDADMIEEASIFAGSIPVKHIIPYWKTVDRAYYKSSKSEMRDASILARNGQWDEAFKQWEKVYQSKKTKDQMMAAFNIALYYEMKDNFDDAITWAEKALELAQKVDKVNIQPDATITLSPESSQNYHVAFFYLDALKKRKELSTKLNIQMSRFGEDLPEE